MIEYAKKVNNLNIRVLYIDDESENVLFVPDFRKLGNEWRLYKGEKYIRCADCEIEIKDFDRIGWYFDFYNGDERIKKCESCGCLRKIKSKYDGSSKYCDICAIEKEKEKKRKWWNENH